MGRPFLSSPIDRVMRLTNGFPEMNLPVMRSSTWKYPFLGTSAITLRSCPSIVGSASMKGCVAVKSSPAYGWSPSIEASLHGPDGL